MALKRRRDDTMWKEVFNVYFIVIISGLLYLILLVTSEPVCYTRIPLDKRNLNIKRVDCGGTEQICRQFASRKDVKTDDILNSPCRYTEDDPFTHDKDNEAITCSTNNLPTVIDGYFECAPNTDVSMGKACALTCNDGFYAVYSNQTVCKAGTSGREGKWSQAEDSFVCRAITCSTNNLPNVTEGSFDCAPNSNVTEGESCHLTCNYGFYAAHSSQAMCEVQSTDLGGKWSNGSFLCHAITCLITDLPAITNGYFDCANNTEVPKDEACTLACNYGFVPSPLDKAVCEEGTTNQGGKWSNGNLKCGDCNEWNEWNGSEYKFISIWQDWELSRQMCELEGNSSHLVTIEDMEEDKFVHMMVKQCSVNWNSAIGLQRKQGRWQWIDGTVSLYRNWFYSYGEEFGSEGHCSYISRDTGKWFGGHYCRSDYAVCERNNPRA